MALLSYCEFARFLHEGHSWLKFSCLSRIISLMQNYSKLVMFGTVTNVHLILLTIIWTNSVLYEQWYANYNYSLHYLSSYLLLEIVEGLKWRLILKVKWQKYFRTLEFVLCNSVPRFANKVHWKIFWPWCLGICTKNEI